MTDQSKISDHSQLSSQGEVSQRAAQTDENITEIAPEYRGHGATPEEKADENKAWISKDHPVIPEANASDKPPPDTYAQGVNKSLGPLAIVKDKLEDGVETVVQTLSGSSDINPQEAELIQRKKSSSGGT